MKKAVMICSKVVKSVAEKELRRDANSTTSYALYQPKAPSSLVRFKDKRNDFSNIKKNCK